MSPVNKADPFPLSTSGFRVISRKGMEEIDFESLLKMFFNLENIQLLIQGTKIRALTDHSI